MSGPLIIGIDAGTSVIKAIAFTHEGEPVAQASKPNSYDEGAGGAVTQDLRRTWEDTAQVLHELGGHIDDLAGRTTAIAVTGQGDGTWLIDDAGEPVGDGWLWLDSRAAGIVEEFEASGVRERFYRQTGCGMNGCNQSAQLVWLKRHDPALLARAVTAFHCKDWLYFNLTGERVTDPSEGLFTFGSFRSRHYVPELMDALGLAGERSLLPPITDGTQATHPLSAAAADACGLRAATPVALGFVDVMCTGLGGGLWDPGKAVGCSIVGSTGMHMRTCPADQVALAQSPTGYTMPFMVPGMAAQMQSNMAATLNIDWIVERAREAASLMGQDTERMEALLKLDARILDCEPATLLFHPYISEAGERGPFVDASARASFAGLSTKTGFADMARAVYEGLSLAAADCYRAMGGTPSEIRIAGGAARSKALKVILASALSAPIQETTREEAGAAGAAMMAAVATGVFPDMACAVRAWVHPTLAGRVEPDPNLVKRYADLFEVYVQMRQLMPPVWHQMAELRGLA